MRHLRERRKFAIGCVFYMYSRHCFSKFKAQQIHAPVNNATRLPVLVLVNFARILLKPLSTAPLPRPTPPPHNLNSVYVQPYAPNPSRPRLHLRQLPHNLILSLSLIKRLRRPPILRLYIIRKRLRRLVSMVAVAVWVVGRTDVFHSVDAPAFGTALNGAVAGHLWVDGGG